ncbi:hypothetical protein OAF37_02050 [Rubripirellula sp.]|nr:hypothetical protein [Rubripirellula sp.]MDB4644819.1 hypothetical protein [Rubripirellula sp.]
MTITQNRRPEAMRFVDPKTCRGPGTPNAPRSILTVIGPLLFSFNSSQMFLKPHVPQGWSTLRTTRGKRALASGH